MSLLINNEKCMVSLMRLRYEDDILILDLYEKKDKTILKWDKYYYNLYVDGRLEKMENMYHLYKVLWDLKFSKVAKVVLRYESKKDLLCEYIPEDIYMTYKRYIHELYD